MRKIWTFISLLVFIALLSRCKSTCFIPLDSDAVRMQARWANYNTMDLKKGLRLFEGKCSRCHALPKPCNYTEVQTQKIFPDMAKEAKLDSAEYDLIIKYFLTLQTAERNK